MKTNVPSILNEYFEGRQMQDVQNKDPENNTNVVKVITHYPERFEQKTTIVFKLDKPSLISLMVYNPEFHCMAYLACGYRKAGYHRTVFDASDLPPGTYIARLRMNSGIVKEYMRKVGGPEMA